MGSWIYVALMGVAALLYAWMLPRNQETLKSSEQLVKEVEITLEQYIGEIQLENEQLVELVAKMKQEFMDKQAVHHHELREYQERLLKLEQQLGNTESRLSAAETDINDAQMKLAAVLTPDITEQAERLPTIKDRYGPLFEMHQEGKSIDMIAKSTGMQRGEVQLIIQLAKQEESI
ncbi:hypothetical protein [Paenibacillus lemnae]|uniref:DUF2802 domain-containing protein n=1 Tax=Paenibacillus lemnae TaxID=1330551 RepID=A0A848M6D9_PAELE|nr:hypothetical protein [Paenibacillus lemnae]NMO96186.1 hypothetical protein [Paenibacillus lemnae]